MATTAVEVLSRDRLLLKGEMIKISEKMGRKDRRIRHYMAHGRDF